MTQVLSPARADCRRRIRAEAVMWVVRLHRTPRDPDIDVALRQWLAEDSLHAAEFERATDVWNETVAPPPAAVYLDSSSQRDRRPVAAVLVSCFVVVVALGWIWWAEHADIVTGVGEQKTRVLSDGTSVHLNTESRLAVRYDARVRKVILKAGEAFFSVAKHERKPFIVIVDDRQIVAKGTSFIVRRRESPDVELTVTLIEGDVAVDRTDAKGSGRSGGDEALNLVDPGQRVRFRQPRPVVETIDVKEAMAWTRGELIFDGMALKDALVEINRYSPRPVRLAEPESGSMRIGGRYRLGDAASFARAVADSRHLRLVEREKELILEPLAPDGARIESTSPE